MVSNESRRYQRIRSYEKRLHDALFFRNVGTYVLRHCNFDENNGVPQKIISILILVHLVKLKMFKY
jgi:hypothetical protein